MSDAGFLEVGTNDAYEVVVNLPRDMTGHVIFSPQQARALANTLLRKAWDAEMARRAAQDAARLPAAPPVDRMNICTTSGGPITDETRQIDPATGMQKDYIVLCDEERAKGFVRPYRDRYTHQLCGGVTTMGRKLSETYARDPAFYSGTFCVACRAHFPVAQFVWTDDGSQVGS